MHFVVTEKWASILVTLFTLSAIIGLMATFDPSSAAERNGSFSFMVLMHSYQAIFTCAGGLFIIFYLLLHKSYITRIICLFIASLALIYFLVNLRGLENNLQSYFGTKSILSLYVAGVVFVLLVWRLPLRAEGYPFSWAGLIVLLLLFSSTAIPAYQNAIQFDAFIKHVRRIADHSTGIINVAHTTLPRYKGYYWTYPFLSIVVSRKPDSAVVLDKKLYPSSINRSDFPELTSYY